MRELGIDIETYSSNDLMVAPSYALTLQWVRNCQTMYLQP